MTCDATFWNGADGDTLPEKNDRLEVILGSVLQETRLSDHMIPSASARLHTLTTGEEAPSSAPVRSLHTSLLRQTRSATVNADLLIVDRRAALEQTSSEAKLDPPLRKGFLRGLPLEPALRDGCRTVV